MLVADLNRDRFKHHPWFDAILRRRQSITQHWLESTRTAGFDDFTASTKAVAEAESSERVKKLEKAAGELSRPGKVKEITIKPLG
jgi:hypothetical protein